MSSFYQMFSAYYNIIFPFAEGKEEFFSNILSKYKPKSALDLGCATGELTSFLTTNGCDTTGIDLSPDLLSLAAKNPGKFILADMIDFLKKPDQKQDLVICIGNTLPHLTPEQLSQFIQAIPNWLNKNGLLIIQTVNYHKILAKKPAGLSTIDRQKQGVKFARLYDYNPDGSIAFTAVLDSPGGHSESTVTLWPFTPTELKQKLPGSLKVEAEYGSFTETPFNPMESGAWVLIAKNK